MDDSNHRPTWFLLLMGVCVLLLVLVSPTLISVLLMAVAVSWIFGDQFPIRQFGYEVNDKSDNRWPVVYETNLDLAFAQMLAARLRIEEIPTMVENENLFNSGINWEFGLSVPLRIRVPREHDEKAHELVKQLSDTNNSPESTPPQ